MNKIEFFVEWVLIQSFVTAVFMFCFCVAHKLANGSEEVLKGSLDIFNLLFVVTIFVGLLKSVLK